MSDEALPESNPALRWFGLVLELADAASEADTDRYDALAANLSDLDREVVLRLACATVGMLCQNEARRRDLTMDEFMTIFSREAMDGLG